MRARRFHAANKVYELEGGNEDNSLWVEVGSERYEGLGEAMFIRSVFVPTDEEREAIASGANITLKILHDVQPPVLMYTTTEGIGKAP